MEASRCTARTGRLLRLVAGNGSPRAESRQLARLALLLLDRPEPPEPASCFPDYRRLHQELTRQLAGGDGERFEEALLSLYCHLHMHEAPYTAAEREVVDGSGGYWCHAGGVSPLLKAAPWISASTVSADLGAGNGLQGLLLQCLYPHRSTILVEISSCMVEIGRGLQQWLGIPEERVRWIEADVRSVSIAGIDFLYLYRPLRPHGTGAELYRRLAGELEAAPRPVVVFSVADCLGQLLSPRFERFYFDGHLACFRGPLAEGAALG